MTLLNFEIIDKLNVRVYGVQVSLLMYLLNWSNLVTISCDSKFIPLFWSRGSPFKGDIGSFTTRSVVLKHHPSDLKSSLFQHFDLKFFS